MHVISMSGVRSARTYAEALALWEQSKPHTDYWGESQRIWDKRKDNILQVSKGEGKIAFRYHSTNVVTYYRDGRVSIRTFDSLSTNKVMETCMPVGMSPDMINHFGTVVRCMRGPQDYNKPLFEPNEYSPNPPARFHPTHSWRWNGDAECYLLPENRDVIFEQVNGEWFPVDVNAIDSFEDYQLDQAGLRKFKQQFPLRDFFLWAKAIIQHKDIPQGIYDLDGYEEVIECLRDRTKWNQLIECDYGERPRKKSWLAPEPYSIREGVENALLSASKCLRIVERDSVCASELPGLIRRKKKYEAFVR